MSHVVIFVLVLTSLGVHGQEFLVEAHPGVIVLPPQPELLHGADVPIDGSPGRAYSFSYDAGDHSRQETSDHLGNVRGSYSVLDPDGVRRRVDYQAGPGMGFVATSAEVPSAGGPDQRTLEILQETSSPRPLVPVSTFHPPLRSRGGFVTQTSVPISSVSPNINRVYASRREGFVTQSPVPISSVSSNIDTLYSPSIAPPTIVRAPTRSRGRVTYSSYSTGGREVSPSTVITPQGVLHVDPELPESRRGRKYRPNTGPIVSSSTPIPSVAPYNMNAEFGRRLNPLPKPLFTPNNARDPIYDERTRQPSTSTIRSPEISVHGRTGLHPETRPVYRDTFPDATLTGVVVETPSVRPPPQYTPRGRPKFSDRLPETTWKDELSSTWTETPKAPAWRADAARRILTGPEVQYETKAKRAHNESRISLTVDKNRKPTKATHLMKIPAKKPTTTSAATSTTTTTTTTMKPSTEWSKPLLDELKNATLSRSKLESFTILARNGLNTNIHSKLSDEMYISKSLYDKIKKI